MNIQNMRIDEIIPYAKNPRKNDIAVEKVMASIAEFGFKQPIVIDVNNVIIVGHTRWLAAQKLGYNEVPVNIAVDLTPEQVKAYRLADNKTAEFAEWDINLLAGELKDLVEAEFDMAPFGFDSEGIEIDVEGMDDFDVDAALDEEATAKPGDIWKLGKHRLMCGDCTLINNLEKLMQGNFANLVFTDPPYRIETEGGHKSQIGKGLTKKGNEIKFIAGFDPTDFLHVLPVLFKKDHMNAYVFCNKELLPDYLNWAKANQYSFNVLVWKKPSAIPIGDSHWPDVEYLLLFRKNAIWNSGLKDVNYSRVIECKRESGLHPTMKPVNLIRNELLISSNQDSIIMDLFGGSGSTLIACESLQRSCYIMELDPKYCDVIIKRWEELTGKKAELVVE